LERGWFQNKDKESPCFHLKWVLKTKDIDFYNLLDHQIVNHFDKGSEITTKWGLAKNLKNMIWYNNIDINTFYPR
jgi:tubulin monoglycylase TTLL3/8